MPIVRTDSLGGSQNTRFQNGLLTSVNRSRNAFEGSERAKAGQLQFDATPLDAEKRIYEDQQIMRVRKSTWKITGI